MESTTTNAAPTEEQDTKLLERIGRYQIVGKLGRGGMAEVLLAMQHDPASGFKRLVVIKRVLAALDGSDEAFSRMFLDEARIGARLNHANVVQTFEVGEDAGRPFIAMEFLDGQALNLIQRRAHALRKPIPAAVALRLFMDALEGLHYAHELQDFDGKPLNLVHRDVTPSNLFVKYDGTAKLVDFGIAKSTIQREKTQAGAIKGKLAYMAPEQLRERTVSRSVDVWAMGVSLWETLAGERLFKAKNDFETVQKILKKPVPVLEGTRADIPKGLDAVIAKALEREVASRYSTAEEFRQALEEVAFGLGKPTRKADVQAFMEELFGEAIQQNRKIVRDFLERSTEELVNNQDVLNLHVSSRTGEFREADASAQGERVTIPSATLTDLPLPVEQSKTQMLPKGTEQLLKNDKNEKSDKIVIESQEESAVEADERRPVWHWAVLALALVVALGGVWFFVVR